MEVAWRKRRRKRHKKEAEEGLTCHRLPTLWLAQRAGEAVQGGRGVFKGDKGDEGRRGVDEIRGDDDEEPWRVGQQARLASESEARPFRAGEAQRRRAGRGSGRCSLGGGRRLVCEGEKEACRGQLSVLRVDLAVIWL